MTGEVVQPVVLDTTVLSNFASSGAVDQLDTIIESPVTVHAVRTELRLGREAGYEMLDDALDQVGESIAFIDVSTPEDSTESQIRDRLDEGEAAALLGAIEHDGTLATDDLAARRAASERDIPVTGSVGLLVLGIRRDVLSIGTANQWLNGWKEKRGYFAPVDRIEDALRSKRS